MADDNRNTEHFALGIIIAAIIFLFLRRELGKRCRCGGSSTANAGGAGGGGNGGSGCTTCPDGCNANTGVELPENPGISVGVSLQRGVYRTHGTNVEFDDGSQWQYG